MIEQEFTTTEVQAKQAKMKTQCCCAGLHGKHEGHQRDDLRVTFSSYLLVAAPPVCRVTRSHSLSNPALAISAEAVPACPTLPFRTLGSKPLTLHDKQF